MTRTEIGLAIVTALLSFLGALAGVYASSHFDQSNWESRHQLEQLKIVLEKRVSLVERIVVLLNKTPQMKGLQASLDAEKDIARLAAYCASVTTQRKALPGGCRDKPKGDIKRVEEVSKEIYALHSDWAAAASLSSLYFGQETQHAIAELNKVGVWSASDQQRQALMDAMTKELVEFRK